MLPPAHVGAVARRCTPDRSGAVRPGHAFGGST
jgi:hypothetical protein